MLPDSVYVPVIFISGAFWLLAFSVFLVRYVPMLLRTRIDGKPG
jgi:uncharacterized protein involved in response to NO